MGPGLDIVADAKAFGTTVEEELAYQLHLEHEYQAHLRKCPDTVVSKGSDPWSYSCELERGHDGAHQCKDPMGAGTGVLRWGNHGPWEWSR